jgi:ribosome-associated translation inhibitor RaiA
MNISIVTENYELTEVIRTEIISELNFILNRSGKKICKTEITLSNQVNSEGHAEKLCVMKMRINHLRALVAKTISSSMTEAINSSVVLLRERLEGKMHKKNSSGMM